MWRKEKSLKTTKRMDDQQLVLITLDLWRGRRHFCVYFTTLPILTRQGLGRLEMISQNLLSGTEKNRITLQSLYVCDGWDSNHLSWNKKLGRHHFSYSCWWGCRKTFDSNRQEGQPHCMKSWKYSTVKCWQSWKCSAAACIVNYLHHP